VLAPRLEGLDDIPLNAGVFEKYPRFIDEERLKTEAICRSGDDGIGAMQDVEEQRFEKFGY